MAVCICNSVHLFVWVFFYLSLLQGCKQDIDSIPTPVLKKK